MSSIFKQPRKKNSLAYNGFDMSKSIKFTSSVGQLLPCYYDRLDPGDKIKISASIFTRTQPMNSAAFTRVTEHIDYFFVPMKLINSFFENQFYGIQDIGSSLLYQSTNDYDSSKKGLPSSLPILRMSNLDSMFWQNLTGGKYKALDEFGIPAYQNYLRLGSLLGFGENLVTSLRGDIKTPVSGKPSVVIRKNPYVNLDLFFAYQRIFSDYYRLSTWTQNNPMCYSADYLVNYMSNKAVSYDTVLSFLNFQKKNTSSQQPTFQSYNQDSPFCLRYRPWKRDYFTNVEPAPLYSSLNYEVYQSEGFTSLNKVSQSGILSSTLNNGVLSYENAYYNSVVNSDQPNSNILQNPKNQFTPAADTVNYNFSLGAMRALMSIEKINSITNSAKKHYIDQTLAHYGFSVPRGISDEVYYLGSNSSRLQIGEVVATATTGSGLDSSVLGEIGGKGMSASTSSRPIKFTAPCHGILMAIYSAVPEADYIASGLDKLNQYSSINDYYHPEYDKLGYQPLYSTEYNSLVTDSAFIPSTTEALEPVYVNNIQTQIFGWQYRYSELKTKYDTIHGAFCYSLSNWVTPRSSKVLYNLNDSSQVQFGSNGVFSQFYINPRTLDPIFEISFNSMASDVEFKFLEASFDNAVYQYKTADLTSVYATDPLLHNIDFFSFKSSKKSVYGIPNL